MNNYANKDHYSDNKALKALYSAGYASSGGAV